MLLRPPWSSANDDYTAATLAKGGYKAAAALANSESVRT